MPDGFCLVARAYKGLYCKCNVEISQQSGHFNGLAPRLLCNCSRQCTQISQPHGCTRRQNWQLRSVCMVVSSLACDDVKLHFVRRDKEDVLVCYVKDLADLLTNERQEEVADSISYIGSIDELGSIVVACGSCRPGTQRTVIPITPVGHSTCVLCVLWLSNHVVVMYQVYVCLPVPNRAARQQTVGSILKVGVPPVRTSLCRLFLA
eukprot:scaffold112705_cov62-Attheya_sp.AAC.5